MHRALASLVVLALATPARAGGIALESYTGERPADGPRLLSPILDELAARGFAAGDTLARSYDASISRAAIAPAGLPADFAAQVDRGFKLWVTGKPDEALKVLGPLVDAAHANTGAIAKDQALREPLLKALIGTALAQQRSGDPTAMRATFGEIIRSFPDAQISRGTYGPEAADAFEQVKRDLTAQGRGKLALKLGDETGVVFVDETYRGVGSSTIELPPGEYRVCIVMNKQPSRSHRIVVRAASEVTLSIDVRLDQAIHTAGWTGFAFGSDADREAHEAPYAARFANAIGANAVAVVGIELAKGRPSVVGSLVSLSTGREIRRASVAMEPDPSTERLRALARFLAGDEPSSGIEVQVGAGAHVDAAALPVIRDDHVAPHDDGAPSHTAAWVAGGLAIGALGTGITLIALDGHCRGQAPVGRPCTNLYHTKNPGYGVTAGGVAIAAVAVFLYVRASPSSTKAAFVVPTTDGAIAGFATRW